MLRIGIVLSLFLISVSLLADGCRSDKNKPASRRAAEKTADTDYFDQGVYCAQRGDYDTAIANFSKAIEIDPRDADVYRNRGLAWKLKGEYERALSDYREALEINSQDPSIYNSIAWLLATCPDEKYRNGTKAISLMERVTGLNPDNIMLLDTLAAAYAETGRFEHAIKTQERAIHLLERERRGKELSRLLERLNSYRSHKPWREKIGTLR